jgi:hypothetical protein
MRLNVTEPRWIWQGRQRNLQGRGVNRRAPQIYYVAGPGPY